MTWSLVIVEMAMENHLTLLRCFLCFFPFKCQVWGFPSLPYIWWHWRIWRVSLNWSTTSLVTLVLRRWNRLICRRKLRLVWSRCLVGRRPSLAMNHPSVRGGDSMRFWLKRMREWGKRRVGNLKPGKHQYHQYPISPKKPEGWWLLHICNHCEPFKEALTEKIHEYLCCD